MCYQLDSILYTKNCLHFSQADGWSDWDSKPINVRLLCYDNSAMSQPSKCHWPVYVTKFLVYAIVPTTYFVIHRSDSVTKLSQRHSDTRLLQIKICYWQTYAKTGLSRYREQGWPFRGSRWQRPLARRAVLLPYGWIEERHDSCRSYPLVFGSRSTFYWPSMIRDKLYR